MAFPSKLTLNVHVARELLGLYRNLPFRADHVREIQRLKLRRLLHYAYERVLFYRKRMDDAGVHPSSVRDLDDLRRLPVLTKEEYRRYSQEEVAHAPGRYANWARDATSGSSGTPLVLVHSWPERAYLIAKWLRAALVNGYRPTYRSFRMTSPVRLVPRDSVLQRAGLLRRRTISYSAPIDQRVAAFLDARPDFLYGNKTGILELALEVKRRRLAVRHPRLYAVGGEVLDPHSMAIIWETFGKDNFFEFYGCEEMGTIGWQRRGDDVLQYSHDTNILELDNHGTPGRDQGFAIMTDLHIRSMPLIRYRLGDWLETERRDGLAVIRRVGGGINDWLIWADGSASSHLPFYELMATRSGAISQFRVVQEAVDLVRIMVVLNPGVEFEPVRDDVIRTAKATIRPEVEYVVTRMDQMPAEHAAKIRMVESKVYRPGQPIRPA